MKKILRMLLFSGFGFYLTSLWDKGFIINYDFKKFLIAVALMALTYYLIAPIAKIILLPLNILTFGLLSIIFYVFLFYFMDKNLQLLQIKSWVFQKYPISYWQNLVLSSLSVSAIINLIEKII